MISKSEKSYIQSSLLLDPPLRADGRPLEDYRSIQLTTGVVAAANGSARISLGDTQILAACKLEVEDIGSVDSVDGGRISCAVSCSPSAYPHHASTSIDDMQYDFSHFLNSILTHPSLRPSNLALLPNKKAWLLNLDCIVLNDAGNVYDALFIAARAALWDTRIPITRRVEYQDSQRMTENTMNKRGLDTRHLSQAADFELGDYWSEGEVLEGRDRWPVCITLNLISSRHFVDATPQEDAAVPLRLLLVFSCPTSRTPTLQGARLIGSGEMAFTPTKSLVKVAQKYAHELVKALDVKLTRNLVPGQSKAIS